MCDSIELCEGQVAPLLEREFAQSADLLQDFMCEELFVETNPQRNLLMAVAVVMRGEGLLCVFFLHLYIQLPPLYSHFD